MFPYSNIKPVRNRFSKLTNLVFEHIDIQIVEKTTIKLDTYFQATLFLIPDLHKSFQLNVAANSAGFLVCIKGSIITGELRGYKLPFGIQNILFEVNLRSSQKWLFVGIYKPSPQSTVNISSDLIDFSLIQYDNKAVLEDFNMKSNNRIKSDFTNVIKLNTCFKEHGSCIDLVLANYKCLFKSC